MTYSKVLYDVREHQATVTINHPEVYNAFDYQTLREMEKAFQDAADDDRVSVLILTGAGDKAFCTGADLKEQQNFLERPHDYWKWFGAFQDAHDKLRWIGKPTIARLSGIVVGGGNEFNMSCDLAVAADHVTIQQIGNTRGSVAAGGATQVFRYTKQQTNFWKEFAWSMTVGHARDWLSIHADSAETREGLESFQQKRPVDYDALREPKIAGKSPEWHWGQPTKTCPRCGATRIPSAFEFCGRCGRELEANSPKQADVVSDRTVVNEILQKTPETMEVLESMAFGFAAAALCCSTARYARRPSTAVYRQRKHRSWLKS